MKVISPHVPLRVLRETGYSQPETAVMYDFDDLTGSYAGQSCARLPSLALRRSLMYHLPLGLCSPSCSTLLPGRELFSQTAHIISTDSGSFSLIYNLSQHGG